MAVVCFTRLCAVIALTRALFAWEQVLGGVIRTCGMAQGGERSWRAVEIGLKAMFCNALLYSEYRVRKRSPCCTKSCVLMFTVIALCLFTLSPDCFRHKLLHVSSLI